MSELVIRLHAASPADARQLSKRVNEIIHNYEWTAGEAGIRGDIWVEANVQAEVSGELLENLQAELWQAARESGVSTNDSSITSS